MGTFKIWHDIPLDTTKFYVSKLNGPKISDCITIELNAKNRDQKNDEKTRWINYSHQEYNSHINIYN